MFILKKKTGAVLECDSVARGQMYPYLYIHTAVLGWNEAHDFFSDAEGLEEIHVEEQFTVPVETPDGPEEVAATSEKIYRGFTELYCIQRSPLFEDPAELMIWLQRPEEED